ncbi:MAG: TetR/AcrR family transcriptional regulator [Spirochaetia bacterium]|jgi:AcrR family transcriptional regulator|nr:TetR/AcrR family transcriptional regulator [Spirochaetia bacterium]
MNSVDTYEIFGENYTLPSIEDEASFTKRRIIMESTILFAKKGYAGVSMRDIGQHTGIKPASLYYHFSSKEILWNTVIDHALKLYFLYHNNLDKTLKEADSFEEVVQIMFHEPSMMRNVFACYAFALIQTEQFSDKLAGKTYLNVFLKYGINFHKKWFDTCIERGLVQPFDTGMTATIFVQTVLSSITLKVQETLDQELPYDFSEIFDKLQDCIMRKALIPKI